jgi:Family of unknown function (DUF6788)
MSDSLTALEAQRQDLLRQLETLGDFRRGSITGTGGRCGTAGCHCHRPGDAGHDAHPRLTYKVQGKTVTESLPTPAAVRKAEREIAEFREYQRLGRDLVEVNEKICRLRPLEDSLTPEEKKRRKPSNRKSRVK